VKCWASLLVIVGLQCLPARAAEPFQFADGDRVVFIGNTLIEREQRYGYWETALTALHPDKNITFRNLGWSGDTVWGEAQARFGGQAEGFRHLKEHVTAVKPTVIIAGYGLNESYAGEAGLPKFEQGLNTLLDMLAATKARIVLLSPLRQENLGPPLPDPTQHNKNIRLYADVMRKFADKRGHAFVDLYELTGDPKAPLTDNGIHLTAYGYWQTAVKLFGANQPSPSKIELTDRKPVELKTKMLLLPPAPGNPVKRDTLVTAKGLAPGKYLLTIDTKNVISASAEEWAKGVAVLHPDQEQVERLRRTIIDKNQTYFHRWRPQNETYLFGFRKGEQGKNAVEIPQFDPLVEKLEKEIAELRVPVMHKYEVRPE
jgi:hypothetical protein